MPLAPSTTNGLATRIVRATLIIGTATVVAAGGVALWSTSRLAAEKAQGRDLVAIQVVEDRIESRLRIASDGVEQVALVAAASTDSALRASVETLDDSPGAGVSGLFVTDASGRVIAASTGSVEPMGGSPAFEAALDGANLYVAEASGSEHMPEVWMMRTVLDRGRRLRVVLARLDSEILQTVVTQASSALEGATVTILERNRPLVAFGPHSDTDLASAEWIPAEPGAGTLRVVSRSGVALFGHYDEVQGFLGADWRIVVTEPAARATGDTLRAVLPSVGVLLLGGFVAVTVAWGLSARIVRPLRELERAARSAAAGSYVKPIAADDRDDEIARVAEAFNAVALRLNALHDLSQLLASASQLDQVLDGILSAMGHIIGPGSSAIYLVGASGAELEPVRCRGGSLSHARSVPMASGGWLSQALEHEDPLVFLAPDGIAQELPGAAGGTGGVLVAPLIAGSERLGAVIVLLGDRTELTEAEREMVRTFSAQAAVAVQNSRLFEEESEQRRTAEALRSVADALVRPSGLEEALSEVEQIVTGLFGATRVRIAMVDRAALGMSPTADPDEGAVLGTGLKALSTSAGSGPARVWHGAAPEIDELLDRNDAMELIVVPIALESDHGAVMEILMPRISADGDTLDTVRALADEIALALDNAYFYERAVARAANLETMFRISQVVGSSLQINVVLNRVLDVVQKILEADAVALLMFDPRKATLTTEMARGHVPSSLLHLEIAPGEDLPGHVFQTGEPVTVHDLHAGMQGFAGAVASKELRSLIAVPLLARSRSIGVLMVFSVEPGAFSTEDMGVLQTFAAQAALALDTARLYGREHEVASVLQRSIIPGALPRFEELETGSVYNPAGGDAEIGGDYYDIFRAPTGEIWLAIADVCGKGVRAATKTSMIKYSVRAFVAAGLDPASVLGEVNRMTAEAGDPSDIVTLWAGYYDPVAGIIEWANGGHPPALVLRTDGSIEQLGPTGPLLGAMPAVGYESSRTAFRAGDTVLLYTDGVTEARQGNTFFGEQRVSEVLAHGGKPETVARRLLAAVSGFVSAELKDDVAILVVTATDAADEGSKEEA